MARLYTDGRFEKAISENFDGNLKLEFHLAPPLMSWFSTDKVTGHPRKMSFGRWMLPVFRQLAKGRRLRGTTWDIFGYTAERKLERQMISDYEAVLAEIERRLSPDDSPHGRWACPRYPRTSRASATSSSATTRRSSSARRPCLPISETPSPRRG